MQTAPIGYEDGMNWYAYVGNDPINLNDPSGKNAMVAACGGGPNPVCVAGLAIVAGAAIYHGVKGTINAINAYNQGAKDADPTPAPEGGLDGWIYGPENDPKINDDGSTGPNTWTTPDEYGSQDEAQDKLDPFKPMTGKRPVHIPGGTPIKIGTTPGGEGPYNGSGGANEVLVPGGLPAGSTGEWKPLNQNRKMTCIGSRIKRSSC